jgi:hypothetical protein
VVVIMALVVIPVEADTFSGAVIIWAVVIVVDSVTPLDAATGAAGVGVGGTAVAVGSATVTITGSETATSAAFSSINWAVTG